MDIHKLSKLSEQAKNLAEKSKDLAGKTKNFAALKGGEINQNPKSVADKINGTLDKLDSTLGIDSRSMIKESIDQKMNKSMFGKIGLAAMNNADKLGKTGEYLSAANSILNNKNSSINQIEEKNDTDK